MTYNGKITNYWLVCNHLSSHVLALYYIQNSHGLNMIVTECLVKFKMRAITSVKCHFSIGNVLLMASRQYKAHLTKAVLGHDHNFPFQFRLWGSLLVYRYMLLRFVDLFNQISFRNDLRYKAVWKTRTKTGFVFVVLICKLLRIFLITSSFLSFPFFNFHEDADFAGMCSTSSFYFSNFWYLFHAKRSEFHVLDVSHSRCWFVFSNLYFTLRCCSFQSRCLPVTQ